MPQNEFKPFAIASSAAVLEQSEYETSQVLREGFKKGLARSVEVNKAIRQASSIAAVVAEFAAEKSGKDMLDNGDVGILKENFETALSAVSSLLIAEVQGTSDVLNASFTPTLRELKNGTLVHVRAKERNRIKTPVFKADETGEKVIVKGNNLNLEDGDIAGGGHWLELQYDEALDKWVLQNPAKGITPSSGVPVGTIEYFAMATPPAGYLKADGSEVGRESYPELFAAIGTVFGEGDGLVTFNLPDLRGEFIRGWDAGRNLDFERELGTVQGDAIREIWGAIGTHPSGGGTFANIYAGAVQLSSTRTGLTSPIDSTILSGMNAQVEFRASNQVPTAEENRPRNIALLACIKAFDAATNPGLIDITELANDVSGLSSKKLDKTINGTAVKYVKETYNDGTNWYRKWSDGWVEQGGFFGAVGLSLVVITLPIPYADAQYIVTVSINSATEAVNVRVLSRTTTSFILERSNAANISNGGSWYSCGQGEQS